MTDTADARLVRPPFFELLDSNPEEAFRQFYIFAREQFHAVPPPPVRSLPAEERQDLFHDVVYHCVSKNFRVLKKYRECGYPFAGWLYVVAHREALASLRRRARPAVGQGPAHSKRAPHPDLRRLLDRVRSALNDLKEDCRRLLLLAADEYTPLEMTKVLGLQESDNKKIADRVRECRRQLKGRLERDGVDWRSRLEE